MSEPGKISRREVFLALAAYLGITAAITWPQLITVRESGFAPDIMRNVWVLMWDFHALTTNPSGLFDANIFFPAKNTLALNDHLLGVLPIWVPLYLITGHAHAAFNLTALLMYALTGWATYLLAKRLTGSVWAAAGGSLFAAFHHIKMYHYGILPVISYAWFPLILLCLEYYRDKGAKKWLIPVSVLYAVQLLSGYYNAYAITIALGAYLAVTWIMGRDWRRPSRILLPAAALAIAVAMNIPVAIPYTYHQSGKAISNPTEGNENYLPDLPSDLFKASPSNKIYGKWMGMGDFRVLQPLFPGIVFLALTILGLAHLAGRGGGKDKVNRKGDLLRYGVPGLLLASISLGPHLIINGDKLWFPLPYSLFAWLLPGFHNIRVPQRFAYTALIFGAVFASFGIAYLIEKTKGLNVLSALSDSRKKALIGALCIAAVLGEVWMSPMHRANMPEYKSVPDVYKWLKNAEISGGVLEIPFKSENHMYEAIYTYMSTIHWKPIANGYSAYSPGTHYQLGRAANMLPDEKALRLLDLAGVEIIIEHGDIFSWFDSMRGGPKIITPEDSAVGKLDVLKGAGLQLVTSMGSDTVWRIDVEPVQTVSVGTLKVASLFRTDDDRDVMVMEVDSGGMIWKDPRPGKILDATLKWHKVGSGVVLEDEVKITLPIAAVGSPLSDIYVFTKFPEQADIYELEIKSGDGRIKGSFQRVSLSYESAPTEDFYR